MGTVLHHRLVCYGDSITQGYDLPANLHWPAILCELLAESSTDRLEIFVRGVGGNTASMGMDRIENDLRSVLPATVLLEFGINDAYVNPWSESPRSTVENYRIQMESMVAYVLKQGGHPVLINNHPIARRTEAHRQGNGRLLADNMEAYRSAIIELAARLELDLIDLAALLGHEFLDTLHADGVHLTPESSRLYGEAVYQGLQSLQCLCAQTALLSIK